VTSSHRVPGASWLVLLMIFLLFSLVGCSNFVDHDQPQVSPTSQMTLEPGHAIGQTFVARHGGLNGVDVWLEPRGGVEGEISLHLRDEPGVRDDRVIAKVPLSQVAAPGFYHFSFAPLQDSHSHYYYAVMNLNGAGEVGIGAAGGETYLDGSLYHDDSPLSSQMAFRLVYAPIIVVRELAWAAVKGLGMLLAAGLIYIVPGWALLMLSSRGRRRVRTLHWAEGWGVAAGLSLVVYPFLLLGTQLVGVRAGPLIVWLPTLVGLVVLCWYYRPWRWRRHELTNRLQQWWRGQDSWPDLALLAIVGIGAAGRLLSVRGLDMPLWDDSVQHTVMVQRILESGGLFRSWEPYAPYQTMSQQFGFHADVAAWAWLTGASSHQAVIWAGQILNLLAVLTLYPLAYRIRGSWAGVVAVLAAGALLLFPGYYTNWGRYPQMAGQAVLPIAAWWFWNLWSEDGGWRWADLLFGALLVAGAALAYYRMAFHFLAFALAAILLAPDPLRRFGRDRNWLALVAFAMTAGLLLLPWLANVAGGHSLSAEGSVSAAGAGGAGFLQRMQGLSIGWAAPQALVVLVGTLVAVWGGGGAAALPVVWMWLLVALPILKLTPVPAASIIQEFTIGTSLYMPQALIWGPLVGYLVALKPWRGHRSFAVVLALVLVAVSIWRVPNALRVIDRSYDLSTRPDMQAAAWIRDSLPDDAYFLINGIVYTDGVSAVGGDAGWWLPLLTRRGVVIPPQYALLAEEPNQPGFGEAVNSLVRTLTAMPANSPEAIEAICKFPQPITHAYLGQRQGMVDKALPYPPAHPMLSAELMLQEPAFRLIYHRDQVMIFEFDRSRCS
jgi:hypothetical protein